MWLTGRSGIYSRARLLDVPTWEEVSANYGARTVDALGQLMALEDGPTQGRLILWHGAPGTGKTTALRALAKQWQSWCEMHYVTDPEVLFASPEYLDRLLLDDDQEPEESRKWRLIIAEDSDEFMRAHARQQAGAALGRLLNATDGLLGQGTHAMILLTTNEPLGKLHPAVVRPGRCMAEVGFEAFTVGEANRWLDPHRLHAEKELTLAELYELASHSRRIRAEAPGPSEGLYL